MISETKIDETFSDRQFYIEAFTPPYKFDWNCHGGGSLVYVKEDIPSKLTEINNSVENTFIELNWTSLQYLT